MSAVTAGTQGIHRTAQNFRMRVVLTVRIAHNPAIAHPAFFLRQNRRLDIERNLVEMVAIGLELIAMPTFQYGIGMPVVRHISTGLWHPIQVDTPQRSLAVIEDEFCRGCC